MSPLGLLREVHVRNSLVFSSTVVYGVFLGFGCFLFALIRAYAPKLTLMSVFGTIAIDIFCVGSFCSFESAN